MLNAGYDSFLVKLRLFSRIMLVTICTTDDFSSGSISLASKITPSLRKNTLELTKGKF